MWRGWGAIVRPLVETIVGPVEKMLWLLLGAVSIVLFIAIGNVANLLLARATARTQEMAIRSALGADRGRIVRQFLTESLLLSCSGGALGIGFAYGIVHALVRLNPGDIPRFDTAAVDTRVLGIAILLSIASGVLFGLAPAISTSHTSIDRLLRQGNRGIAGVSYRGRFALIVAEVALSVMLLAGAGLLLRSYLQLQAVNPGFSPATLTFRLNLDNRYNNPGLQTAFYKRFLAALENAHGVHVVGASNSTPLSNHESVSFIDVRGAGKSKEVVENRSITPGYRRALGTALLRGRDFTLDDVNSKTPVAIVNQSFVRTYFHGHDALGQQVRMGIGDFSGVPWSTVVGVVGDIRHIKLEESAKPQIFLPADYGSNFAVQCSVPARTIAKQAGEILRGLDPALTLENVRTMNERVEESNARRTFQTTLLSGFAVVAIALALAGLYGLMSYSVKRRTAEIGVRMAVGSSRARILRLVLSQGLSVTAAGLAIGLAGAFALTRLLRAWLFGVSATDPVTFVIVPLFVFAVAGCACLIPAWSATRVDPMQALRQE